MSPKTHKLFRRIVAFLATILSVIAILELFETIGSKWLRAYLRNGLVFGLVATMLWITLAAWSAHRYWNRGRASRHDRDDKDESGQKHGFWYEFTKDFAAPIMVALAALFFGAYAERQKVLEADNQSKAAVLREMFTKGNGPDVAFFTAIGDQLTLHLQRCKNLLDVADKKPDQERKAYLDENALFDEKAIYFFYGMFRAGQIDFLATKGYVLYPRIWMEVAFQRLSDHIVGNFAAVDERLPEADPHEEAALYDYFEPAKAIYNGGSRRANEPIPDLFGFAQVLKKFEGKIPSKIMDDTPRELVLEKGFAAFQERLRDAGRPLDLDEIIATVDAIVGVDDYAFNTLFAEWYHQFKNAEVPVELPKDPPREFLPYPLDRFEAQNDPQKWEVERQKAWALIFEVVPAELKEKKTRGQ